MLGAVDLDFGRDGDLAHDHIECDFGFHSDSVGNLREILNVMMLRAQFVEQLDAESACSLVWSSD